MNYVLCTMYYILCTMYYVLCTMYYILYTIYYVLCTMYDTPVNKNELPHWSQLKLTFLPLIRFVVWPLTLLLLLLLLVFAVAGFVIPCRERCFMHSLWERNLQRRLKLVWAYNPKLMFFVCLFLYDKTFMLFWMEILPKIFIKTNIN